MERFNGKNGLQAQADRASERDQHTTDILDEYVKHQKRINCAQLTFKWVFFVIVCFAFAAVIAVCLAVLAIIAMKPDVSVSDIGVAITSAVSLVSAVNVLPTKIAEHLFPSSGEKDITDFIMKMHEVDTKIISDIFPVKPSPVNKTEDEDDEGFIKTKNECEPDISILTDTESKPTDSVDNKINEDNQLNGENSDLTSADKRGVLHNLIKRISDFIESVKSKCAH